MATPYMGLTLPIPTLTPGPLYAFQEVTAFETIDAHDHTPGKGPKVPVAGIDVNADFPFQSFNATLLRTTRFDDQPSPPALGTDLSCLSSVNGDLYYNNGTGFPVQITAGNGLNATSIGGIGGDYATSPASVFYTQISGTFTFWQNTNQSAKLDVGPITIRNPVVGSQGITLSPPAGLVGSYGVTFPLANPASTKLVGWSATGQLIPAYDVDNASIEFDGSLNLRVKALGIQTGMIALLAVNTPQIADDAITTVKVLNQNITAAKIVNDVILNGNCGTTGNFAVGNALADFLTIGGGSGSTLQVVSGIFGGNTALVQTGNGYFAPNGTGNTAIRGSNSSSLGIVSSSGVEFGAVVGGIQGSALRVLRVSIDGATGNIGAGGEGITASRTGTGQYQINFTQPFSDTPVAVLSCSGPAVGTAGRTVILTGAAAAALAVETRNADTPFALADTSFQVIVVGAR